MPTAPPRACHCGGRITNGKCDRCGPRKENKRAWHKLYSLRAWRDKAQPQHLEMYPLCQECERQGKVVPATVVDHIEPHRGDMGRFLDWDNMQSLCDRCHNAKSSKERMS